MTGILFVTAKRRAFQPAHTIAVKAFADYIGAILPLLYDEELLKVPDRSQGQKTVQEPTE